MDNVIFLILMMMGIGGLLLTSITQRHDREIRELKSRWK